MTSISVLGLITSVRLISLFRPPFTLFTNLFTLLNDWEGFIYLACILQRRLLKDFLGNGFAEICYKSSLCHLVNGKTDWECSHLPWDTTAK